MAESLLKKNIEFLIKNKALHPHSADKIENCKYNIDNSLYEIVQNSAYSFTINYRTSKNDKFLPLTSKRNPQEQAIRSLNSGINDYNDNKNQIIIIIGFSNIELVAEALNKYPQATIMVATTDIQPTKLLLENINFSNVIEKNIDRFKLLVAKDEITIGELFIEQLINFIKIETHIIPDHGAIRVNKDSLLKIAAKLRENIKIKTTDILTFDHFAEEWNNNQIKSLPYLVKQNSIQLLKDKFKDFNAIMVAAGPSLSDAIPYLKKIQNNAVIISVGTALKTLIANGINPHFTIAIDSSNITPKQFENVDLTNTIGILSPMLQEVILKKFTNNSFFFTSHNLLIINEWLTKTDHLTFPQLVTSGTVSISALDLARFLGCKNIYSIGLDLAYSNDGHTHAKDGIYSEAKAYNNLTVQVAGNYQNFVTTHKTFARYITQSSAYVQKTMRDPQNNNITFYNVNNAGAQIDNFTLLNFDKFSEHFSQNNQNSSQKLSKIYTECKNNTKLSTDEQQLKIEKIKLLHKETNEEFKKLVHDIIEIEKLYKKFAKEANSKTEKKIEKLEENIGSYETAMPLLKYALNMGSHAFAFLENNESISSEKKIFGYYKHLKKQTLDISQLLKKVTNNCI
ncbi:6-hydroxymethylpterin diphosphokinase MptE-like protein [Lentisphaerota bacterium WC36G]|nr:DUF115 domain-containing protein [Lentisphaerae bacterium WC36]